MAILKGSMCVSKFSSRQRIRGWSFLLNIMEKVLLSGMMSPSVFSKAWSIKGWLSNSWSFPELAKR